MRTNPLFKHAGMLAELSKAMVVLAEEAPDRMTLSQGMFFLLAASADLEGKPTTYTEIKEEFGEAVNRSLHGTYRVLLKPSRPYPNALGWLDRVEDPTDNRRKLLTLTAKGRMIIQSLIRALERA